MKRFLTMFLAVSSVALLMLASCKKNDALVTSAGSKSSALTASVTTLILDKGRLTDTTPAITFSFTKPQYTFKAAVTNELQIDAAGDNWKNPATATINSNVYTQGYSTANFNALLLKLNLPAGVASQVNVRIQNGLSTTVASYSNVIAMKVTPFNLSSWLYVVGSFEGWSLAAVDSLESPTSNGIYTGVINFTTGHRDFLILPQKSSYDNKYATNDPVNTTSSTVAVGAPNNFYAPADTGEYIVTLNVNNPKSISFAAADYYSVIGSSPPGTAWSTDSFMKYVNDGNNTWVVTLPMIAGEYKFRLDAAWGKAWGPSGTDGIVTDNSPIGDGNIALAAAGNYKLTFVMPATALGTTPLVTTTYTITKQ